MHVTFILFLSYTALTFIFIIIVLISNLIFCGKSILFLFFMNFVHLYLFTVSCLRVLYHRMKCRTEGCGINTNTTLSFYFIVWHAASIMSTNIMANSLNMLYYNHRSHFRIVNVIIIIIIVVVVVIGDSCVSRSHFQQRYQIICVVLWRALM